VGIAIYATTALGASSSRPTPNPAVEAAHAQILKQYPGLIPSSGPPSAQGTVSKPVAGSAALAAPVPPATSCPIAIPLGISAFQGGPFQGGQHLINQASAVGSDGRTYQIYAGGTDDNAGKGQLIVTTVSPDPCRDHFTIRTNPPIAALNSLGTFSILAVAGDTLTLRDATGLGATFNFVTARFS
jgi:hypothetical protein